LDTVEASDVAITCATRPHAVSQACASPMGGASAVATQAVTRVLKEAQDYAGATEEGSGAVRRTAKNTPRAGGSALLMEVERCDDWKTFRPVTCAIQCKAAPCSVKALPG